MPSLFIRKLISSKDFFCNALRNLAKAKTLKLAPRDTRVAVGERGVISKLGTNVFGLLFLFVFSTSVQASCEYVLTNYNGPYSWSAEITVTNTGNTDVIGWDVSWSYPDTSTPYHPSGYSFSNSNSVYTAEAPSYNSGIYTLSPGEVAVVSFSGGGNGSGVADSVTGDICGPAVISESLTIVKEVINDNGGTAVVADFGITTDAGALTFDAGTTSGDTTTYTSTELTINEGTFSLSELDVTDYDEGTWSCSGASGAVVSTFNAGSVEVAVGEHVTCTITNDDTIPVITPPSEYTKGVCSIDPATQFWQRGVEYNSNNGGDPTLATGINTDVFSRAESFSAGPGISFTAANTAILITGADQATYTEAYEAGDYLEYTVETIASLPDTAVISGFSENGGRDGTAPYQMDMIVSDDNFATGVRLFSGYTVDDNIPADSTSTFSWITDNLQQIYLEAGTEYKFRVVFYGATPNNTNIMMDDFAISVDNCTDRGDAPYEVDDENQGGHYLPLVREHYLGTVAPDAEFYVPGDDNTDGETTTDEENGVILPSNFNVGQSATITASVIGSGGLLNAWIDWDGNEVFDADEKITTDTALAGGGSSGTITLNLTVPSDAVVGTSYARFRWSPNSVANATDFVAEGEMEDYEVTIVDEPVVVETVVTSVTPTTIVSVDVTPEATYCSALQVQRGVHLFTVPAGVTEMNFKGWGAGGHSDFNNQTSGPGGYTEANIPVTPGDQYTIIVGGRGGFAGGTNGHGFGGEGSTAGSGGGLTGLFTGSTAVSSDEQSRAILISGGGGGSDRTIFLASSTYTTQNQLGGSGGDTVNGGGQNTMKGADGSSGVGGVDGTFPRAAGGGGGGYAGGSLHQRFGNTEGLAGNGGTSYINSGLIVAGSDTNLFTPEFDYIPPNITDVHYVSPFGEGEPGAGAGNDGLVVIQYNDGTCDDPILTIEKTVIKDNAGTATDTDWTLTATDGTTTISGVEGDAAITTATVAAGTYTLSESGPSGYEQTSLSCIGAVDTDLTDGLSLVTGETVTCTFTNDDLEVDALVRPTQCGAWNHKGWITYGYPDLHDSEVVFNSGDATNDPYLYLQLSRDADGRVLSYFGATDENTSGVLPTKPGSNLTSTANNAVGHESEYHTTVYRLEGVAGTSESISLTSVGGFEWTSYWTENTAGTVLESLEFEPTWGTDIGTGEILSVPVTYPADGIVYLYVSQFDPSAAYGRPGIDGYSCPVSLTPEVTVTKSAGATGTLQADGTFTQAFTITLESTGDAAVTAPSLVDNLEVLFGDMYTPSTDAVTTSGVSIAPVVTADAGNTGVAPAANANFDGDTSDDLLDGTGSLEAGDSISVTFTVVLDAAETPASGTEVNAVTATATPPTGTVLVVVGTDEGGVPTSDGSAGATITPPTDSGAIGVVKTAVVDLTTAGGAATLDAGDTVNYTYVVTNTSTSLNAYNITVSETASFTGTGTAPSPAYASGGSNLDAGTSTDDLAPAETLTWTASYVLTQDDIEAGKVDNQAKADATDSLNNALTDLSDEADATVGSDDATSTPLTQVSSLSIVKADPSLKTDADTSSDITLGDTLEYVVTVTNDGNVTQNNVVVSDAQLTLSSTTCVTLAPGATCVLMGEHVVTLAEADAGEVVNTAGVISDELPTSEASNIVTTPVITEAELTVLKSAATLATDADTSGDITFGDTLEYTVTVTNEGTATQNNVVVTDAQLTPNSFACATLAPAATCVLTGTHVVTLAEADAGKVVNTAAAESDEVTTPVSSNTITTPVITEAELTILKSAATLATDADTSGDITFGDTLEYTVTVTNEGTAPQNNVVVTDPQLTPNSFACATLAPAATCILTGTHEVTLAEADAGNVVNTAAAESDEVTTPVSSNTITTPVITEAELTVLKSAATLATDADTSGDITFGDTLEYTVTVTNEGTATQNNVVVTDPQLTPSSFTCATLAPAATCVLTGTHEVTLAEADAGNVVNTAAAESDEVTTPVSSNTITTPVITEAELTVLKSAPTLATDADTSGDITFGDTLEYTVTVTNEGTATQNNVVVTDAQLTPNSFACATLAPAATCVLTGTHVVTLAEADAGKVVNTAAAESDEVTTPVSSNTITTPVITEAELTVLKSAATLAADADTSGDITFGDTLEYTVTVTNEGTATQNNVVVTDPQLTPSSFTCATLAPAATCVLTGTHEVTLAEADAGNVVNTAAAESDEVTTPVSSNTITTPVITEAELTVLKSAATLATDADTSGDITLGDTLEYTVTVTNEGTATQNNVVVTDAQLTPSSFTCATLAPAATCVLTGTHVVTLAEADAGKVVNTATAESDEVTAPVASNTITTPVLTDPSLDIVKAAATISIDADSSMDVTLGDTLEYVITATNDGNETLTNVVVSDAQLTPNSTNCATLAPTETCVLTGTHEVTLAEADAGQVVNTAGVVSDEIPTSVPSNTVTTPVEGEPLLTILKSAATLATDADTSGDITLGDTLEYTITATNTGNTTVGNVVVSDVKLTPSTITCATLAPNATCVLTGTHEVTLAEVDAGLVVNTADVTSDVPPTSETSNTVNTPIETDPSLSIVKAAATLATDADSSGDVTLGDTLSYTITATNDGNATQSNVIVSDAQLTPNSMTCVTLAPGATCVLTGTHDVTLAEADAGTVDNTAGVISDEMPISVYSNTVNTPVLTDPSLEIIKAAATIATDADNSMDVTLGDTLQYVITVTNSGNATQNNVVVSDTQLTPSSFACATLAPAATCVLTGTHEVTLVEADAGQVVNTAGVVSDEVPTSVPSNTVTTPVEDDPLLEIVKSAATLSTDADSSGDVTLGDTLEYTITATNTGNSTITDVDVTDAQLTPSTINCPTLAPSASCVLIGAHVVTLAEVDAGVVVNTANVVSDVPPTNETSNTVNTPVLSDPSLDIVKAAATLATDTDSSGDITLGDTVSYTITVTNDGNSTQNNVVVSDTQLTPSSFACATLAPNATCVLTGTHEITLAEVDAGVVVNTAAVVSDELPTSESSNTVTTPVLADPSLALVKADATLSTDADSSMDITLGDTIEYVITATNNGNETLTNVVISDAQLTPSSMTCATLSPGATCVLTGTHEITLAEADAGQVVNTAGVVSDETPTSVPSNTVTTPIEEDPLLTIVKATPILATDADSSGDITLGDTLEYTITVTNTGNTTVSDVDVTDPQLTPSAINCPTLAPAATCVLTGLHVVTLAEVDAGQVENTANVVSDVPPTNETSNTVTTPISTDATLDIVKAAATLATDADTSGDVTLGDTLEYTVTVTNSGNSTQNNVVVSDTQLTPNSFVCATLAPNATCVLTGTHEVTLAEADAGAVLNTASVVSDEVTTPVPSDTITTLVETDPLLTLVKADATLATDADSSTNVTLGDTLEYVVTATNDGNETLTNVIISDAQLTPNSMTCATLAPAATCVLTGTHVVTLAEADAGAVLNTAGVISDEITDSVASNTVTTTVVADSVLAVVKSDAVLATDADNSGDVTLGDTLEYTVTVANTGNTTQNNVVISDTQLTPSSFTCVTLAPGATCELTGTHVVTLAEVDAAKVVNTAGAVSDEVTTSVPSNTVTTLVETDPALTLVKSDATLATDADSSGDVTLGDTLEYVVTATNSGNATQTNVVVTDAQLTPSSYTCATLAPAATCVLTGTHDVTIAEANAGEVLNTAGVVSDEVTTSVPSNTVTTPVQADPTLTLIKSDATLATDADSSGNVTLGDTLEYVITATNAGNVALNNVIVSDAKLMPSSMVCATLAPNATCELTGTHVVTLAETDVGDVVNTAGVVSDETPTSVPSNTITTPVETDPTLSLVKAAATLATDADSSGDVTLGDTLEYVVTATNTGNATQTNVVVSDVQLTPNSMTCATLAPNATCVLTGTHEVTLAEADAGEVVNTAGVISDEVTISVPSNTVVTPIGEDPALTLVKAAATLLTDADSSGDITFGDTLEYVITATNNGNVTLNNMVVSDAQLTPNNMTCATVAPGATCVLTGTHEVTLAEADAGEVLNTAGVVSDETPTSMPSNTVTTTIETDPSLDIVKAAATLATDADSSGDVTLGDTLAYTVTVTNDGNTTQNNVIVSDAQLTPSSFTCSVLAPSETCVLMGTHEVTLAEADAGEVLNTAGVTSDETPTSVPSNTVKTTVEVTPSLAIVKSAATLATDADNSTDITLGDMIEYVVTVTNDGNTTQNNVVVSDAQLTPPSIACAVLAPSETCVLTGTHEVTLAEADAGEVLNTAGVISDETPVSVASNTVTTPVETTPSLSIVKSAATLATDADSSADVTAGDTLEYVVTVTNNGNSTQNNVVVSDAQLTPPSIACAVLAPSETCVLTGTHEVTLAEADAGEVLNTAGVISDETPTSVPSNTVTTAVETDPSLTLVKSVATLADDADGSSDVTYADTLEYVITATNTGNATQTNVVISDPKLTPNSETCATVAPGATCVLTGMHEVTMAEAIAGEVVNTAGVVSDEVPTSVPSNTVTTVVEVDVLLEVVKGAATLSTDADGSGDVTLGDTLQYVITTTNTGNITQNNVVVSDAQLTPSSAVCATLAPNASCELTGTHVVALAEADAGEVVNVAGVVSAETPTSIPSNTVTTLVEKDPALSIVKAAATLATDADSSGDVTLGDTLEYVVTATNTGNATQTNVVVSDAQLTLNSVTCATLAPGATCVLTGTHDVTLAEADTGTVENTAGVISNEVTTSVPSNTVTTPVETDPALSLVKAAATLASDADSSGDVTLGDTLEYVITATNTGNATQNNVVISDVQLTPSGFTCATLAPGATCVLTGTHEVTLAEATAGEVLNIAGVISDEVTASIPSNTVTTPIETDPSLTLNKSDATLVTDADSSGDVTLGDTLEYVITATNAGNVALNNVIVSDAKLMPSSMVCATLAPNATCELTGTHVVTLAEADAGDVVNTAGVVSDETPTSVPSNTITTPVETDPTLSLVKAAATLATDADSSGDVTLGDTLEYVVTATNTGNATQTNVVVSDVQLTPNSMTCATLAPNATCVLTGTHEVTLAEADAGEVVNTAGVISDEAPTSVSSNTVVTPIGEDPALTLVKAAATLLTDADSSGDITFGDTLEYVITATNNGNVTLNNMVVSDAQLTPNNMTCATVAPGATCVLTGMHEVTLAEADAGEVLNTAGVVSDETPTSMPSNTVTTPIEPDPALSIVKAAATLATDADSSGDVTVGDTLQYVVTVTNDGNTTQNNVVVSDAQLTPSSFTCSVLAPSATCVLTGTHMVSLPEANVGVVLNTAGVVSDETPTSLASNTVTTPVTVLVNPDNETGTAVAGTPSTPVADVTDGDTINGQPVQLGSGGNATISESGTWPTGITLDPATGAVSTDATVPAGTYTVQYELCDLSTPANCELATVEITVMGDIAPDNETGTAVAGTPSTPVADVTDGDMVNGQPAQLGAGGNATISESGTWPAGITLDPVTGAVSTDATVPAGTYTVQYELCDLSTPANCELATVEITVAAEINPDDETGSAIAGTPSTPVADVTDGDMVNGQPAQLGAGGNATISESGTWPTGITLDPATGAVSTDALVQPDTYTMQYELCDRSDPANCELATVVITVAAEIMPDDEVGSAVAGTLSTPVANVTDGDMVNGQTAQLGDGGNATISESGTWPAGITLDPATGAVSTDATVPAGTYIVQYELCDLSTPANCELATVEITVIGDIAPDNETGIAVAGTPSTPVADVTEGDVVNGQPAQLGDGGNATISESGTWPAGITLDPETGAVNTDATVQPGVYTMQYELCDLSSPANCELATVVITVAAEIIPDDEAGEAVAGAPSTPVANVTDGDMVNGQTVQLGDSGNATISESGTWPAGITLDPATGAVSTDATVPAGTYTVQYELCDLSTPANCELATVEITVMGDIAPDNETGIAVAGTPSTLVADVTEGDVVNGQPAQLGDGGNATISESGTWPAGITLDPETGAVNTDATVQPGVYTMQYELCDLSTPANCELATVEITVAAEIIPDDEAGEAVAGAPSTPVANVTDGDMVNGQTAQLGDSGNATISESGTWPAGITLDPATGAVNTDATVQPGVYTMQYELCDLSTPANCELATVEITVAAEIIPDDETGEAVAGTPSTPVANVTDGDMVNGQTAQLGDSGNATISESGTWPTGITLDPATGAVSTDATVPAGTYTVQYELCDLSTPANCEQATVEITVIGDIVPDNETGTAVAGTPSTPVADVTDGDVVNGQIVQLGNGGNATISESGTWPVGITLDPATGAVSTDATVQPGVYTMQYELCDLSSPANCELATVEITVAAEIIPDDEVGEAIAGTPSTPVANVTDGDMVNGQTAQLGGGGNATISELGTWPAGITLNTATGAVSTDAIVQPGVYTMKYELCDLSTPANCELAEVVITVTAAIVPDNESGTGEAGTPSTPVADVTGGDMVNGQSAQLGDGGNATISESGEWPIGITLDPETGAVNLDATAVAGTYTIQYQLCDLSDPANCELATITIVVEANLPPVAADDSSEPNQFLGQPVTVETVGNDSDPEDKLDPTSVKIVDASGNPVTTLVVEGEGTWTVNPTTGAITFTPEDGFLADPTPITYTISDLSGNESNAATVSIDYEEPASITGVVWVDANQNGVVDADEESKAGWTLQVKDAEGNVVGTAVTDADGNYSITGLIPDEYTVEFYDTEGTLVSTQSTSGRLAAGQSIVLPLPLAPVIVANPDLDDNSILLTKSVNKKEVSVGDQLYYTVRAENLTDDELVFDLSDDLPTGFKLVEGKVKLTHAGNDAIFGTADDIATTVISTGVDPVRFGPITLAATEKAQVGYLVKVGTGTSQGSSVNTAQAFASGSTTDIASNIATASVEMIADTVIDQATLVGKVFHDRDGDGYQDPANVTGLTLKSDYFGWNSLHLGGLNARVSELDNAEKYRKVVRMPWGKKNDFKVTTHQGTVITVDTNGQVSEAHVAAKAKGWTSQDLRITTRRIRAIPTQTPVVAMRIPAQETDVLEITITNHGIQEEGIPGVRLATVKGLVIETDGYGRYNIPDVDGGKRRMGQNFIIKVDLATLPHGARMTTENPRVLRLTGTALEKINFGVKLYQKPVGQTVKVELNEAFFDGAGHHIKASHHEVMDDIANKIKQYGRGHITIDVVAQSGMNAQARRVLAQRRAHSVKTYLLKRLGSQLMTAVKVEISTN